MLGSAVRAALNKSGSCQRKIVNQLKTVDDYTLTIKSIVVSGSAATARVQTVQNGKKVVQTVSLAKQKNGWRITSLQ